MKSALRTLVVTGDGSHTIQVPELNLSFHSLHGAIGESRQVFIEAGFDYIRAEFPEGPLSLFEMGFGTGLNAFLTALASQESGRELRYTAIDAFPLEVATTAALNYPDKLGHEHLFHAILLAPWGAASLVQDTFTLRKEAQDLLAFTCRERFHGVYFDAFSPEAQPELWTEDVFRKLGGCMHPGGVLVTYCSKSVVRRALVAAGWRVEKLPGPWGKREMVRAHWIG